MVDCVDGIDEDNSKWESCNYSPFTIYGMEYCKDVHICPSGYPIYVEIKSVCDTMFSCQGASEICDKQRLASAHLRYTPVKVENVNYLHYCLLGLEDIFTHCFM